MHRQVPLLLCMVLVIGGCAHLATLREGATTPEAVAAGVTGFKTGSAAGGPVAGGVLAIVMFGAAAWKAGRKKTQA